MRANNLALVVLQKIGHRPVVDSHFSSRQCGRVAPAVQAKPGPFHADKPHVLVLDELVEEAKCVGPSSDARDQHIRLATPFLQGLPPRLLSDHGLELSHHGRGRVWAHHGAGEVIARLQVVHPVPECLRRRIFETAFYGYDL